MSSFPKREILNRWPPQYPSDRDLATLITISINYRKIAMAIAIAMVVTIAILIQQCLGNVEPRWRRVIISVQG